AASFDGKCKSILFPFIAPPVSPAIASPYPDTHTLDPNGITDGSTATTLAFGFLFKSIHVAVIPEHPVHLSLLPVADIVISLIESLLCSLFYVFFGFLSFFVVFLSLFLVLLEFVFVLLVVFFSLFVSVFFFVSACLFVSFVFFVLTSFVFSF